MAAPSNKRPCVLIVRDGWGANPHPERNHANAVFVAETPVDDELMATYPHTQIVTHGPQVGLPDGVMGNSEVGHQHIGAGRIVLQEIRRITRTIETGAFFQIPVLVDTYKKASQRSGCVHIMGLCSDAGVHSVLTHLYAILEVGRRLQFDPQRVFVHAITDGRDTPPNSGVGFIRDLEAEMAKIGVGRVASVVGRYYAMDRDNRWDRVEQAYRLYTEGAGLRAATAEQAVRHYYDNPTDQSREGDEFITPTIVAPDGSTPLATIKDGDSVIFFNFRGDRPREIIKAFQYDTFPFSEGGRKCGFDRPQRTNVHFTTLTAYQQGLPVNVMIVKPEKLTNIFAQYISDLGLRQFRCAETEKYAHVTFFFNDYREEPFDGEDRHLIPSPRDVATYDLKPEMSASGVTDEVVRRIESGRYDFIIVNFANGDMVGHTGNLNAAVKAVEAVDHGVGCVVRSTLRAGGDLVVTADHGNCEQMIDPTTQRPHTAHTTFDVELIVVGETFRGYTLRSGGGLADIAPTLLEMRSLPQPVEMSGQSLLIK